MSSSFSLKILGTASAVPVIGRHQSAQVLDVRGRFFLIDCGEGVQHQLFRFKVPLMKIEAICISHIHGDHVFGLFGLLSTFSMEGRQAPLDIYAPGNFGPILKFYLSYYGEGLGYEIRFHQVACKDVQVIFGAKSFEILAFPLKHRLDTFGYMFREKMPQMNIRKEALAKYGFTLAEIGTLKRGEDLLRPAGPDEGADFMNGFTRHSGTDNDLVITNAEAAYRPYEPRSYAYVSDTAPFPQLASWVKGVDLLYHESTYLAEFAEKALARFHSTTLDAARCALEAGAGKLVIAHYSSSNQNPALYQAEARTIFPETYAANDGDVFEIPEKKTYL
ncbi:MAG: ribonuclease Z [Bacteroidales bacterium]|nr:ribonuclease Z [Bacteroidales bacterium]MDD6052611.1 ribonuclease Z [Bacteroidales bacterium]